MTTDDSSPPVERRGSTHGDQITLLSLVLAELGKVESRIAAKIDESAAFSAGKWRAHDVEHEELALVLKEVSVRLDAHLREEERQRIVFDAQMGPIKRLIKWTAHEWRTVGLAVLLLADLVGQVTGLLR